MDIFKFADWILWLVDGKLGGTNKGEVSIDIPDDLLITNASNPIGAIIECTSPNLLQNMEDDSFFQERVVLAPINEIVTQLNEYVLSITTRGWKDLF